MRLQSRWHRVLCVERVGGARGSWWAERSVAGKGACGGQKGSWWEEGFVCPLVR